MNKSKQKNKTSTGNIEILSHPGVYKPAEEMIPVAAEMPRSSVQVLLSDPPRAELRLTSQCLPAPAAC